MAEQGPAANLDVYLGKLAVDWGLITQEQLRAALAQQSREVEEGRIPVRRLGEILLSTGLITKAQLDALLEAQRSRHADPAMAVANDMRLGQHLVQHGLVTPRQVNECLKLQAEAVDRGDQPVPTLCDLLLQKQYIGEEALRQALETQQRTTLICVLCGKRYPVTGYDPTKAYRCRDCKGDLVSTVGMISEAPEDTGLVLPFAPAPIQLDPARPASNAASTRPTPAGSEPSSGAVVPAPVPFGRYLLMREIGRGGMAVVYEAKDTTLDRKVALKMMIDNPYLDPAEAAQDEERFLREARFCASLSKHPNIVSVYEAGVMEGKRYIVMEFIEGHPMSRWRRMGSLSVRQQIALLRDVALAVHFAHDNGIIHRDLKPQNVLVDEERRPHITDFGLAKAAGDNVSASLTAPRMTVGTPQYMSPEQAKGLKTVDRRTDVWSLGVMLFEILTGRPPFTGVTPIEILMKVVNNPVPTPSQVLRGGHPALDKSIESICMRALAKDPRDRYPTAKAFAEDLSRWLKGEEVRPVEAPVRSWLASFKAPPWVSRVMPYAAAAVAVAAVVYAIAGRPQDDHLARDLERAEEFIRESDPRSAYVAYSLILRRHPQCAEALVGKQRAKSRMEEADARERAAIQEQARQEANAWAEQRIEQINREKKRAEEKAEESRRRSDIFAGRPFLTLPGHSNVILAVAYSPDGQTLASSSFDDTIRIWDVKTHHARNVITGAFGCVLSLAFSPDGSSLLSGGSDASVRVWNAANGEIRHLLTGHAGPVHAVAWSPAGDRFSSAGTDRIVRIWDAASGRLVHALGGHADAIYDLDFSRDGKVLASAGGDRTIRLWDAAAGRETAVLKGHTGPVRAVAFDPRGTMLASGSDDKMVMFWDPRTGQDLRTRSGHSDHVLSVAFASDGRTLASGGRDKMIKMWDAVTGEVLQTLYGHTAGVRTLAFSPDAKTLVSGAGDFKIESDGRVSVWGNIDLLVRFWGGAK